MVQTPTEEAPAPGGAGEAGVGGGGGVPRSPPFAAATAQVLGSHCGPDQPLD